MRDEKELRKVYQVVLDSWKMYKAHTGTVKDWAAIVAKSDKIAESIRGDNAASHILHGFLLALEAEDTGGKNDQMD